MKKVQQGFTLIELMIVVAIIGILAAIAIPQYQDYTARAQTSEAMTLLAGLKTPIMEEYSQTGVWSLPTAGVVVSGKYVSSITAGTNCLSATFASTGVNTDVGGKKVNLAYNTTSGAWTCSTDLKAAIAPKSCATSLAACS